MFDDPNDPPAMLAKLFSYTLVGIDAAPVEVEVDVSAAVDAQDRPGRPGRGRRPESTHRVERAIVNSGYRRPIDRIVINLAPADLKKDAGGFDLPIALGLLAGQRPGRLRPAGRLRHRRRAGPHRRDPAGQGRPRHGPAGGRRGPRRPARARRPTPPRPPSSRGSTSTRSAAWPRPSASSPASSTWTPRSVDLEEVFAAALAHARRTSSTSRARTTPSAPC